MVAGVSGRPRGAPETTGDDPMQYLGSVIDDNGGSATPDEMAAKACNRKVEVRPFL